MFQKYLTTLFPEFEATMFFCRKDFAIFASEFGLTIHHWLENEGANSPCSNSCGFNWLLRIRFYAFFCAQSSNFRMMHIFAVFNSRALRRFLKIISAEEGWQPGFLNRSWLPWRMSCIKENKFELGGISSKVFQKYRSRSISISIIGVVYVVKCSSDMDVIPFTNPHCC